jgi:carbon storage regulator
MLILTRKIDQAIVIQENILVKVLGIERDRVKLGVCAPEEIVILREELCQGDRSNSGQGPAKESPRSRTRAPSRGG